MALRLNSSGLPYLVIELEAQQIGLAASYWGLGGLLRLCFFLFPIGVGVPGHTSLLLAQKGCWRHYNHSGATNKAPTRGLARTNL